MKLSLKRLVATGIIAWSCALPTRSIHAQQASPIPAYAVAEIEVLDPQKYKSYVDQVQGTLVPFGGKFLVRGGGSSQALEGDPPKRYVVIAFESTEKARAWYGSPAYEAIRPIRLANAKSRVFIVEGIPPQ